MMKIAVNHYDISFFMYGLSKMFTAYIDCIFLN